MKPVPLLIIMLIASLASAGDVPLPKAQARVYDRDGNIYTTGQDGKELQLTALGKDSHAVLPKWTADCFRSTGAGAKG